MMLVVCIHEYNVKNMQNDAIKKNSPYIKKNGLHIASWFTSSYLLLLKGELPSSMVGIFCSPGLIHKIGPSLLLVGCMSFKIELLLQGIV